MCLTPLNKIVTLEAPVLPTGHLWEKDMRC